MSMASYNLLKAAADGLADAINYRTNLKRRRREEEYDYNKNWERNEQEYQRDLQRGRDEEQWNFDLKQNRIKQERARQEDWLNTNSPYDNIKTNDPLSYDIYDARAAINDVPIAAKYREPVRDTLSDWKIKEDYKNALAMQRDAAKAARGGGQPRDNRTTMQKNYDWLKSKTPKEREELQEFGLIPNSVKGDGQRNKFNPYQFAQPHIDKIFELAKQASEFVTPSNYKLKEQLAALKNKKEDELSEDQKTLLAKELTDAFNEEVANGNARLKLIADEMTKRHDNIRIAIEDLSNGEYTVDPRTNGVRKANDLRKQDSANVAQHKAFFAKDTEDKINMGRNPSVMGGQNVFSDNSPVPASSSVILYNENENPSVDNTPEQIPPSVQPIQTDSDVINLLQSYRNNIVTQAKSGRIGQKMYRQYLAWLDGMLSAYAKGEITGDVIVRSLRPYTQKNQMTGAR